MWWKCFHFLLSLSVQVKRLLQGDVSIPQQSLNGKRTGSAECFRQLHYHAALSVQLAPTALRQNRERVSVFFQRSEVLEKLMIQTSFLYGALI